MLHWEYTTSCFMPKHVIWPNCSSNKQARQTFHCLVLNSRFLQLSECKYVVFVCLSVRLQVSFIPLSFRYFGRIYSFCTVNRLKESRVVPPTLWFSRKRIEIIFRGRQSPWKLKSAKNNPHVFDTKPRKFGDAKISHYTVVEVPWFEPAIEIMVLIAWAFTVRTHKVWK